jgi:hypothetical protein
MTVKFQSYSSDKNDYVETEKPVLDFGLDSAVPMSARAAWGARALTTRNGIEFVWNRKGYCWKTKEDWEELKKILEGGLFDKIEKEGKRFSRGVETEDGRWLKIRGDEAVLFTLIDNDKVKVVGNTNASHGYFYLAVWLKGE